MIRLKGTDRSGILWCLSPLKNLVHVNFCELKILFSTKVTAILPAFHGREILPSTSDSASDKLFAESFLSTLILMSQAGLYLFALPELIRNC